jgi:hypothetical protein
MNLMNVMLVSLWAAGWVAAVVRTGLKARATATAKATRSK